jgi:hypothetical protein
MEEEMLWTGYIHDVKAYNVDRSSGLIKFKVFNKDAPRAYHFIYLWARDLEIYPVILPATLYDLWRKKYTKGGRYYYYFMLHDTPKPVPSAPTKTTIPAPASDDSVVQPKPLE